MLCLRCAANVDMWLDGRLLDDTITSSGAPTSILLVISTLTRALVDAHGCYKPLAAAQFVAALTCCRHIHILVATIVVAAARSSLAYLLLIGILLAHSAPPKCVAHHCARMHIKRSQQSLASAFKMVRAGFEPRGRATSPSNGGSTSSRWLAPTCRCAGALLARAAPLACRLSCDASGMPCCVYCARPVHSLSRAPDSSP